MSTLSNSSFLSFAGGSLTTASSVADAYELDNDDSYPADGTVTVGISLNRANDPTALLAMNWAQRAATLKTLSESGSLWTTYGADVATYNRVVDAITALGIGLANPSTNLVSSAASRTIWVTVDSDQFKTLFGRELMENDNNNTGYSLTYWRHELEPNSLFEGQINGLWIDEEVTSPVSTLSDSAGVTLAQGAQSIGNALDYQYQAPNLSPAQTAALYNLPLAASTATGTIALAEPNITDYLPKHLKETYAEAVTAFRALVGVGGTARVYTDRHITGDDPEYDESARTERDLDVGVVSTLAPNSTLGLYAGSGGTTLTSYFSAIWDTINNPKILSTSFSDGNRVSAGSPFRTFVDGLYADAALRGMSVLYASGDGGSSNELATGLTQPDGFADSPYAIIVGGTSLATFGTVAQDNTLATLMSGALAGDRTVLRQLVEGGMRVMPTNADAADRAVEAVWNEYAVNNSTIYPGYLINETTTGGVDATAAIPSYQLAYGLTPTSTTGATGRGEPDVSALAGGDAFYAVPNKAYDGITAGGGTSAAAPFWAALTAQLNAVFADQGLPALGYYNDLLYVAAAVAPGSFNDIQLGNNTSSFTKGGGYTTDDNNDNTVHITPTGYGYSAGVGYDLTTGLGTPNGLLLARALTQIAQAQMYSPDVTPVSDATGLTSAAAQALIVQATPASGTVDVAAAGTTFRASAGTIPGWSARVTQQVLQSGFDPQLVAAISGQAQAGATQVTVTAGQSLAVTVGGTAAMPTGQADTAAFGFVTTADAAGDTVTYVRPLAVAETYGGQNGTEAILRIRQTSIHDDTLTLYRVDDLLGDVDGIAPGQAGYATATSGRKYATEAGMTTINTQSQGSFSQVNITGVDNAAIIGFSLTDNTAGQTYWGLAAQNAGGVNALWSYGANTWGFNDGSDDGSFADTVFQLDFTSNAGSGLVAFDAENPASSVVSAISSTTDVPAGSAVGAGHVITFTLQASTALTVTAAPDGSLPTLTLDDGGTATLDATASSGTSLVFRTTVTAGQTSQDLTVTGLSTNGATLANAAGVLFAAGSLLAVPGAATGLVIDGTAPAPTPVPTPTPTPVPIPVPPPTLPSVFLVGAGGNGTPGVITNGDVLRLAGRTTAGATVSVSANSVAGSITSPAGQNQPFAATVAPSLAPGLQQVALSVTASNAAGSVASTALVGVDRLPGPVNNVSTPDLGSFDLRQLLDQGYVFEFAGGTQAVQLTNGTLSVGTDTNQAVVQRLYQGLLGRSADAAGLAGFAQALAGGTGLAEIAGTMMASAEYAQLPGVTGSDDAGFISHAYAAFTGRAPATSELSGWVDALGNGTSRAMAAAVFATAPESKAHLAGATADLWAPDANGELVTQLYMTGLGRNPELSAVSAWTAQLGTGLSAQQLAQDIAASPEFGALHNGQSPEDFVSGLFASGLGRTPDAAGLQGWTGQMRAGAAPATLLLGIATSPEAYTHLAPTV